MMGTGQALSGAIPGSGDRSHFAEVYKGKSIRLVFPTRSNRGSVHSDMLPACVSPTYIQTGTTIHSDVFPVYVLPPTSD